MCRPEHFTVRYAINPWMTSGTGVDTALAIRQWQGLRDAYASLGHSVQFIDGHPDLPDMVFAANGATVIGGTVLGARFRHPERAAEGPAYLDWFRRRGYRSVHEPRRVNEGEGDIVHAGGVILAGHGFRTEAGVRHELAALFGLPVISLRLVRPALLPPGHRALRAGRGHRRVLSGGVRRGRAGRAGGAFPGADRGR